MFRKCKGCPKDISTKHKNAKFCSPGCKDRYHNRTNPRGWGLRHTDAEDSFDLGWDGHKDSF